MRDFVSWLGELIRGLILELDFAHVSALGPDAGWILHFCPCI